MISRKVEKLFRVFVYEDGDIQHLFPMCYLFASRYTKFMYSTGEGCLPVIID